MPPKKIAKMVILKSVFFIIIPIIKTSKSHKVSVYKD